MPAVAPNGPSPKRSAGAHVIEVPLIIGGGITGTGKAYLNCKAGADVIVVGNAIERRFPDPRKWRLRYTVYLLIDPPVKPSRRQKLAEFSYSL